MADYLFTDHARAEIRRRGLSEDMIWRVLEAPEQRLDVRPGRVVLQSRVAMGEPAKQYLVRVFVDMDRRPAEVVTAYRTSRIRKYWRGQP